MLKRFNQLLLDYYAENKQSGLGVPSVQYCASELAYSPRYLGDMIHKATGGTAIGYIHSFVVERGKSLLMHGHNVSETAHLLGFGYTHHFNRIFKKVTGLTGSSRKSQASPLRNSWRNRRSRVQRTRKASLANPKHPPPGNP